jgi:hypothetical protein
MEKFSDKYEINFTIFLKMIKRAARLFKNGKRIAEWVHILQFRAKWQVLSLGLNKY